MQTKTLSELLIEADKCENYASLYAIKEYLIENKKKYPIVQLEFGIEYLDELMGKYYYRTLSIVKGGGISANEFVKRLSEQESIVLGAKLHIDPVQSREMTDSITGMWADTCSNTPTKPFSCKQTWKQKIINFFKNMKLWTQKS